LRFFALHSLDLLAINQEDKKMSKLKTLITTSLTPVALCLTLVMTAPVMARNGYHQQHDGNRQILSELSLTDTQKQDIKQILKQTKEDRGLFSSDAKSLKTELRSLIQSAEWDQAAVITVITQHQALKQQKALQRASNKNQVWNLLTDAQQAEFVTQLETRKAKREKMNAKDERKNKKQNRLGFTEEQLAAIQVIKEAAKESRQEIKTQLKSYKQAEQSLIQSVNFDSEAWQTLSSEYQANFLAMVLLKAKTKHDIWNLMTTEQQAMALEMPKKSKGGKKGNKQKRF
jgi:Spy/CpxP family protein refolding chaperone